MAEPASTTASTTAATPAPETRACAYDPAHLMVRPPGMDQHTWDHKRTCGRHCASQLGVAARAAKRAAAGGPQPKPCELEGCQGQVVPIPGERRFNFNRRRYHTRRCRALAAQATRGRGKALVPPTKPCRCGCGKTVHPAKRESQKRWDAHHYATKGCANLGRGRNRIPEDELETKLCGCGCKTVMRRNPSKQDRATFAARKYASHECSARARRGVSATGRATSSTPRRHSAGSPMGPGARKAAEQAVAAGAATVEVRDPGPPPTWRPASFRGQRDARPGTCDHGTPLSRACPSCAGESWVAA